METSAIWAFSLTTLAIGAAIGAVIGAALGALGVILGMHGWIPAAVAGCVPPIVWKLLRDKRESR